MTGTVVGDEVAAAAVVIGDLLGTAGTAAVATGVAPVGVTLINGVVIIGVAAVVATGDESVDADGVGEAVAGG